MKKLTVLLAMIVATLSTYGQSKIKDGTINSSNLPNTNAILDLESSNKGVLMPRVQLTSTALAAPLSIHEVGMTVYNTASQNDVLPGFYYNDGTKWVRSVNEIKEPWYISGSTNQADSNHQHIYQKGDVAIGIDPGLNQTAKLYVNDMETGGEISASQGILNRLTSNRQGTKSGIRSVLIDKATAGTGSTVGIYSTTADSSTVKQYGAGARFDYQIMGGKDNGDNHIHGVASVLRLNAISSPIANQWNYGNYNYVEAKAVSQNINITGGLRTYSGYNYLEAESGFTSTSPEQFGAYLAVRPTANGGTINVSNMFGLSADIEPSGGSGSINVTNVVALRSNINMWGAATKNINSMFGLLVTRGNATSATINNCYGIFIEDYGFSGTNPLTTYNLYSKGVRTKNFFEGKVGIGQNAPAAALHVVKSATDLTPAIINGVQEYVDNAAAISAGLPQGALYRTGDVLKVVH